jgi:hypothetical protein
VKVFNEQHQMLPDDDWFKAAADRYKTAIEKTF